jgi:chondroitin AC lyase
MYESKASVDIDIIKKRLLQRIFSEKTDIESKLENIKSDGSWEDIDYEDQAVTKWQPKVHIDRIKVLAVNYNTKNSSMYSSDNLKTSILSALQYWVEGKFNCPNWWYNEIGVPAVLGDILLLMGEEIPDILSGALIKLIKHGDYKVSWTGQNLIWGAGTMIKRACIEKDEELIEEVFKRANEEICIAQKDKEGIQIDYSFHQHGNILYSGGYGKAFAIDCIGLLHLTRGTKFKFSEDKVDILVNYLLDGQRWFNYKNVFDYSAVGREITRCEEDSRSWLLSVCDQLLDIDNIPRRDELEKFAASLREGGLQLHGNRSFWKSDMMTHHRKGYYTSVKMVSNRTVGTESGNGEGLKNFHISEGCTYIFRTGKEYNKIFPVWDWKRIPGTTVEQIEGELPLVNWGQGARGKKSFVGGVSDGEFGCAAMKLRQGKLKAKKSWFYFDREVVALGADIRCDSQYPVYTSINQCHLQGSVAVREKESIAILDKGEHISSDFTWIHHDNIGYIFQGNNDICVKINEQMGSWNEINRSLSKNIITEEIFNIWIDHGNKFVDKGYSYIIVPDIEKDAIDGYCKDNDIEVLDNNRYKQVVWHKKLNKLQAVFWKHGRITLPDGTIVKVDKPCLLMIKFASKHIEVTAANPKNKRLSVNIEIFSKNEGKKSICLELPCGEFAGQSISEKIKL